MSTTFRASARSRLLSGLGVLLMLAGVLPAGSLAAAPSGLPTLTSPAPGETVSANPSLAWNAVSGAVKYRVQVSTNSGFTSLVYNADTSNTKATPTTDLPLGTLHWRVAATDGTTTGIGPFAESQFVKAWGVAPTPTAPADGATLEFPAQPVLFAWAPLPGAKSYTVQVDDAADFVGATEFTTANTSYALTEPQTVGQTFYWRVRATSSNAAVVSDWSTVQSYQFSWANVPQLLTPENTTVGTPVEDISFSWQPVDGAKTYQLQVSPNGDWANNVTEDVVVRGTRYAPAATYANGSYFWRVRAQDARNPSNNGGWSDEWQFTRGWPDRPTLLGPAWSAGDAPAVVADPTFSWTPVEHASHYEIQFSLDPNFSPGHPSTVSCYTNQTTFTPYTRITGSGEPGGCSVGTLGQVGIAIYWHVRAIDAPTGVLGLWSNTGTSDTFRFIRDPGRVTLTAPADGATVERPTLTWAPVDNIEKYIVTIKKSDGSTNTGGTPKTTYGTSFTPATLNPADGPFHWYVQTVDGNGVTSPVPASSDWRTFTLETPATTDAWDLLTPVDGASSVRMPSMSWEAYTGAAYYRVRYGANGFANPTPLSGTANLTFTAFTYEGLTLTAGTYVWWVEAYSAANSKIAESAQGTFTIVTPDLLGTADYTGPAKCVPLAPCDPERQTPTLSWNAAGSAGAYEVTIANDAEFTNVLRRYVTAYNDLTPRESLVDNQAGQAFYWFVRPCVDMARTRCGPGPENSSANDRASAFQKRSKPVSLTSPANGATISGEVTFAWQDYLATNGTAPFANDQEARQYRIQVSLVSDFATIVDTATVDQPFYTPSSKTYPVGPLYWRVQAIDGSNNLLTVSASRSLNFTHASPAPSAPGNGATVTGVPSLAWAPVERAATYTVEVYRNGDTLFSPANRVTGTSSPTKFTAWAPTVALPAGTYAWRVRGNDADGKAMPWSAARTFKLQPLAPALTSPANGYAYRSNNLHFTWTAVPGAVQYRWEASTSSSFSAITASQLTVMTAWAPATPIADGSYYWRVRVLDAAGNVIATSSTRAFSKDSVKPSVIAKSPTTNASIVGPFTVTFSEPVKNVSTSTFKMVIAGTSTAVAGTVSPSSSTLTTTATFTPAARLLPGQSYTLSLTSGVIDARGNTLVPMSWNVRTSLTVDSSSPALVQVWDRDTTASANGGGFDGSRTVGSRSIFTFTGTNVSYIAQRAADGGKADVYLDGVKQATVDFYSSTTKWQQTVWSKSGLTNAKHTLDIRVLGTKSTASSSTWVYVDAFKVGTTTYQENNSTVRDIFRVVSTTSAYGGSYLLASHAPSSDTSQPQYTLVFRGTDVVVYGTKSTNSGKAAVYVDGVNKGTIDFYRSSTAYKAVVFDSATLSNAQHTLTIKPLGTKVTASKGTDVSIDQIVLK